MLRKFIKLFPSSNVTKLLLAYFAYRNIPSADEEKSSEGGEVVVEVEDEDYAGVVMVGQHIPSKVCRSKPCRNCTLA